MNRIPAGHGFGEALPRQALCALLTIALATVFSNAPLSGAQAAPLSGSLTQISSDPFTVGPGQHATEVEPHMLANGPTLVAPSKLDASQTAAGLRLAGQRPLMAAHPGHTDSCRD
jgi:hypothetical protein